MTLQFGVNCTLCPPTLKLEFIIAPLQAVILLPEKESPEGADENRSLKPEFCFNSLISNLLLISLILHLAVVLLTSEVLLLMFPCLPVVPTTKPAELVLPLTGSCRGGGSQRRGMRRKRSSFERELFLFSLEALKESWPQQRDFQHSTRL